MSDTERKQGTSRLVVKDGRIEQVKTELKKIGASAGPLMRAIFDETLAVLRENGIDVASESDLAVTLAIRLNNLFAEEEFQTGSDSVQRALTKFYAKVSHHHDDEIRILREACKRAHTELVYLAEQVKARKGGSVMRAIKGCEDALGKF